MKKLVITLVSIAFLVLPTMLNAQNSSIEKLFDEYVGEDGFTSVNISKEMFLLFAQMGGSIEDEEFKDLKGALSGLNGMKILSYTKRDETSKEFNTKIDNILDKGKFVELMTIKEVDSNAKFMLKKEGDDIVELLLVSQEGRETTLISFFGIIDLESISRLSKSVQIKGLENFEKINKKYDD